MSYPYYLHTAAKNPTQHRYHPRSVPSLASGMKLRMSSALVASRFLGVKRSEKKRGENLGDVDGSTGHYWCGDL